MKYALMCCDDLLLCVLSHGRRLEIETRAHVPHLQISVSPGLDAEELSRWNHLDAAERNVTEIQWGDHRSWIIRCGGCPQQVEISEINLPKMAEKLAQGKWPERVDGMPVVPLGVLNRIMGQLGG